MNRHAEVIREGDLPAEFGFRRYRIVRVRTEVVQLKEWLVVEIQQEESLHLSAVWTKPAPNEEIAALKDYIRALTTRDSFESAKLTTGEFNEP